LAEFTGERVIPGLVDQDLLNEHVARYRFAARFGRAAHVLDAGCGAGRQTFVLANELKTPIHAVDSYQPFVDRLRHRAKEKGFAPLVRTHCMDMKDIPNVFPTIDLLWAEGSAAR